MGLLEPLEFHFFPISPSCQKKEERQVEWTVDLPGASVIAAKFENAAPGPALCLARNPES